MENLPVSVKALLLVKDRKMQSGGLYNNNNNNNNNKLQLDYHPVAVVILHVYRI